MISNIFIRGQVILRLTAFNPGLALTDFRTTRPSGEYSGQIGLERGFPDFRLIWRLNHSALKQKHKELIVSYLPHQWLPK